MGIILWLIIGGVIGWLASIIMRTDAQQGIFLNIVVGIVGAFIGGLIFSGGSIVVPGVAAGCGDPARDREPRASWQRALSAASPSKVEERAVRATGRPFSMFGIHHLIVIPADAWNHGGGAGARGVPAFKCVRPRSPHCNR